MCRLFGFRTATDSSVNHSLVEAENALAKQSEFHQDGWGIAYYIGGYNGEIAGFSLDEVKERVLANVDPHYRRHIMGGTDSEAIFHIFLSRLAARHENIQCEDVVADDAVGALGETVALVREAAPDTYTDPDTGEEHVTRLNLMVTNGNLLVGLRFRRDLFYSTYKKRCPDRDTCESFDERQCEREVLFGQVKHLIVTSEPVSTEVNVWHELSDGECVYVDRNMFIRRVRLLS